MKIAGVGRNCTSKSLNRRGRFRTESAPDWQNSRVYGLSVRSRRMDCLNSAITPSVLVGRDQLSAYMILRESSPAVDALDHGVSLWSWLAEVLIEFCRAEHIVAASSDPDGNRFASANLTASLGTSTVS